MDENDVYTRGDLKRAMRFSIYGIMLSLPFYALILDGGFMFNSYLILSIVLLGMVWTYYRHSKRTVFALGEVLAVKYVFLYPTPLIMLLSLL